MGIKTPPFIPLFGSGIPSTAAPQGTIYFDRANNYAEYVYDVGNWRAIKAFGPSPVTIVQQAISAKSASATFAVAPTPGNLMVALADAYQPFTGAYVGANGFVIANNNTVGSGIFYALTKTVVAEGVVVTPVTGAPTIGTMVIFEIANAVGTIDVFGSNFTGGALTLAKSFTTTITNGLLLGLYSSIANSGGNGAVQNVLNATKGATLGNINAQGIGWSRAVPTAAAYNITGTSSISDQTGIMGIAIK